MNRELVSRFTKLWTDNCINIGSISTRLYRRYSRIFIQIRPILYLSVFVSLAALASAVSPARAQSGDGVLGWYWDGAYYSTGTAACQAQWNWAGMNNGYSRFIGAFASESPNVQNCLWTSFQYLCPQETGGGINNCWTILPANVVFYCDTAYIRVGSGHCVRARTHKAVGFASSV